ncbi:unnamed protein product [Amoebophrya sp. A120]|nr:unnamed protein product [Amoebophrya sp. A120]|eukprot:GSA120T00009001001.1
MALTTRPRQTQRRQERRKQLQGALDLEGGRFHELPNVRRPVEFPTRRPLKEFRPEKAYDLSLIPVEKAPRDLTQVVAVAKEGGALKKTTEQGEKNMNNSLGQKQDSSVVSTADASTMADEPVRQRLSDYEKRLFYLGKTAKEKALLKAAAKGEDDGRTSKRDHGDEGTNEKKKQANSKPRNISCCCCNLSCCCCAKSFCGLILLLFLVLLVDEFLFFHGYYDVWFYGGKKKYDYYQIKRIKTYPSGYQEEELYYVRRGRQNGEEEYARAEDLEYDARTRDYYHKTNYNFDYDDRGAGASDYYQRDRASSSRQGQHNINSRSSTGTASPDDVKRPTKVQEAKHAAARQKQREGSHAFAKEVGRQGSEIARERASTTAAVMGDKNQKNENPGAAPGFVQKKQEQERDDHVGQKQENEIYQQTTTPTSSSTSSSQHGDHTSSSVDSKVSPPHPPPPQELAPGRNDQDGAPAKMTASSVQGSIPKDQEQNHEAGKVSQQHQVQDPEEQPMKQENGQHQEEKKSENDVKTTPSSSSISSTTTTVGSSVNKDPTTSSSTSSKGKRPGTWLEGKSKMFRDSGTDEDETSEDDLALFKDDADAFKTTENYPHQQGTTSGNLDEDGFAFGSIDDDDFMAQVDMSGDFHLEIQPQAEGGAMIRFKKSASPGADQGTISSSNKKEKNDDDRLHPWAPGSFSSSGGGSSGRSSGGSSSTTSTSGTTGGRSRSAGLFRGPDGEDEESSDRGAAEAELLPSLDALFGLMADADAEEDPAKREQMMAQLFKELGILEVEERSREAEGKETTSTTKTTATSNSKNGGSGGTSRTAQTEVKEQKDPRPSYNEAGVKVQQDKPAGERQNKKNWGEATKPRSNQNKPKMTQDDWTFLNIFGGL